MKKLTVLLLFLFFSISIISHAQFFHSPPEIIYDISSQYQQNRLNFNAELKSSVNWIMVDTLPNSLGPALWSINPLAYDHYSNTAGFVHRGHTNYAAGAGELWYNLTSDAGQSWVREGSVNSALPLNAHYPSMAIYNPNAGGLSSAKGLFFWSETPSAIGYGLVDPLISGTPSAYINSNYSGGTCWTGENWMYWNSDGTLFRTQDFINIEIIEVLNVSASLMNMGGVWLDGNVYIGYLGTFDHPDPGNPIHSGWYPGYIKSTDNGATWQELQVVDFRTIESLQHYDRLFDYKKDDNFVSYTGDINVDKEGFVHFILSVTDTTTNSNTGLNSLIEIYETTAGWNGKVIYEGIDDMIFTSREGPAVGQMGPSGYLAFDSEREVMVCVWVIDNKNSEMQLCDVFISYRTLDSEWSSPINLTETNNMNENGAHLAPVIKKNTDDSYTAFVGYFYELDYFGPDPNSFSSPAGFWIAPVTFSVTNVLDEQTAANDYQLDQNFPNPFNPNTAIKYQLRDAGNVTLKVYDVLGSEVATLVSEYKNAGSYEVEFNGKELTSGVYFYQLKARNYIETKKMVLLR